MANNPNIEEIFALLSKEKKLLKPEYAYKTAEEGLLSAHHFFRWCKNSKLETVESVIEQFSKKKVPEQQVEHFGGALIMLDHYPTDEAVKDAIRDIEKGVRDKTGKSTMEMTDSAKIERRIYKNVYNNFSDSIEKLKIRSTHLKKSSVGIQIAIAVLFLINGALVFTGVYRNLLESYIPGVLSDVPFLQAWGDYIVGLILFVVPVFILLFANRHKLREHGKKGGDYPEEIRNMEKTLEEFGKTLEEKKVQRSEFGGRNSEVGGRNSEVRGRNSEVGGRKSDV